MLSSCLSPSLFSMFPQDKDFVLFTAQFPESGSMCTYDRPSINMTEWPDEYTISIQVRLEWSIHEITAINFLNKSIYGV